MPIQNLDVSDISSRIADLFEIEGANHFRIRAYRNAFRTISRLARDVSDMVESEEDLSELPGIGLGERAAMEKMAGEYSLKIVTATASGNYLADAKGRVENLTGKKVFECTATGPWLYVNIPAGTYKVTASFEQKSRMRKVTVGTGLKTIMFHWKP